MMKIAYKRILGVGAITSLIVLGIIGVLMARTRAELAALQVRIEAEYPQLLSSVENYMLSCSNLFNDSTYETETELRSKLAAVEEIYSADCSHDGHHGLQTLKMLRNRVGFSFHKAPYPSGKQPTRTLSKAESMDGELLLLYEGWLPQAPIYRNYRIAFDRQSLESRRRKDVEPPARGDGKPAPQP